jgi:hypothetical protein
MSRLVEHSDDVQVIQACAACCKVRYTPTSILVVVLSAVEPFRKADLPAHFFQAFVKSSSQSILQMTAGNKSGYDIVIDFVGKLLSPQLPDTACLCSGGMFSFSFGSE